MYDFKAAASSFVNFPVSPVCQVALDFETTGLALRHGDSPFMLSATFDDGRNYLWQAEVDPFTRRPNWSTEDITEISEFVSHSKEWEYIMTNKKFDTRCLAKLLSWPQNSTEAFLSSCHETIGMHHALKNNESHALKDAAAKHAGISDDDEAELKSAVNKARKQAALLGWSVASRVTCPQVRKRPSKGWGVMDYWVPRQLALYYWRTSESYKLYQAELLAESACSKETWQQIKKADGWKWHPPEISLEGIHPWHTVCAKYCRLDTLRSVRLFTIFKEQLIKEHLWDIYVEHQINSLMTYRIEENGVCLNVNLAKTEMKRFLEDAEDAKVTAGYAVSPLFPINPRSPDQVRSVLYGKHAFNLPVIRRTVNKKNRDAVGQPTIDKDFLADVIGAAAPADPMLLAPPRWYRDIESYDLYINKMADWHYDISSSKFAGDRGKINQLYAFCASVLMYKKSCISVNQIQAFIQSALNLNLETGFAVLYPSINPWGTKTIRQASSNPNGQNISKGGKSKKSVAHLFKTKQTLRILFGPAPGREWWNVDYSQLQLVIFAFMCGDDRLISAVLRGDDFHDTMARLIFSLPTDPEHPDYAKQAPTEEQRGIAKNVVFGFLFGAQEAKINQTAGMPGLYEILCNKLPTVVGFLESSEWEVRRNGFVRTMGGYKLYVPEETPYAGSVYKIQGTEGEIVKRATYGVQAYLDRRVSNRRDFYITLPVHDELNYDSRLGYGEQHIGSISKIMDDAALSYGVAAKVKPKYCAQNWAKGKEYEFEDA